jgi:hypothetical protein
MTKALDGGCGNGAAPSNDGCRAGAKAWPRTEKNPDSASSYSTFTPAPGARPFTVEFGEKRGPVAPKHPPSGPPPLGLSYRVCNRTPQRPPSAQRP